MQPFERLRALARYSDEDEAAFVTEAADCLAGFEDDPAGLVVACRRLLAHRPSSGALWWLCARVLCAPDAGEAAWQAWKQLGDDPTATRLAALLPFPHDDPIAVAGWPEIAGHALSTRPDLDVLVVRARGGDRHSAARLRRVDLAVRVIDQTELLVLAPSHLLIEVSAAGASRAIVPRGTADLASAVASSRGAVWLVAGAGRVLPERLFMALAAALEPEDLQRTEFLDLSVADKIAGPAGLESPASLTRRVDCPVAPELLRLGV